MKISIHNYNPIWIEEFNNIKNELLNVLDFLNPHIEHIGSTSIDNLSAKPIIDIAVGLKNTSELDLTIKPMIDNSFIYYEAYNVDMPLRRLFVGLKDKLDYRKFQNTFSKSNEIPHEKIQKHILSHIHIWEYKSIDWNRHIAFRNYISINDNIKKEYEKLKIKLSSKEWKDGNEYNMGKNAFIKKLEKKAIKWYKNQI